MATVLELWRYPVKGMRGEPMQHAELDAHGLAGDRRFALESTGAPRGKPLLSGVERAAMLLYTATGEGEQATVRTPAGDTFAITDPDLLRALQQHLPGGHTLSLRRSATPQTDVRPVALLGTETVAQLAHEFHAPVDPRRFRANLILGMPSGFAEDRLAGHTIRIGPDAVLRVLEQTPRCRIVTLDPETALPDPTLMKHLDRAHGGRIGVYAAVVQPGTVRVGDAVTLFEAT